MEVSKTRALYLLKVVTTKTDKFEILSWKLLKL